MRGLVVALALLPVAVGCGPQAPARSSGDGVVLWQSRRPEPRFPVPPDAGWLPKYQRLRMALAAEEGKRQQWACYRGGRLEEVLDFYAPLYRVNASTVPVAEQPAAGFFATVRTVSARLGAEIPADTTVRGTLRRVTLHQRGELPTLILESPFPNPANGRAESGTLISLSWQEPGGTR